MHVHKKTQLTKHIHIQRELREMQGLFQRRQCTPHRHGFFFLCKIGKKGITFYTPNYTPECCCRSITSCAAGWIRSARTSCRPWRSRRRRRTAAGWSRRGAPDPLPKLKAKRLHRSWSWAAAHQAKEWRCREGRLPLAREGSGTPAGGSWHSSSSISSLPTLSLSLSTLCM